MSTVRDSLCIFSLVQNVCAKQKKKKSPFGQCRDAINFPLANVFPLHLRKSVTFTFEAKLHWSIPYEALFINNFKHPHFLSHL